MLRSIKIKNVGCFVDFTNEQARFSKGASVVHGMNGSGKSQLCCLLQLLGRLSSVPDSDSEEYQKALTGLVDFVAKRKSKESEDKRAVLEVDSCRITVDTDKRAIKDRQGEIPDIHVFNDKYIKKNVGEFVTLPEKGISIGERNKRRDKLQKKLGKIEKDMSAVNEEIDKKVDSIRRDTGYSGQKRTKKIICRENYLKEENPYDSYPDAESKRKKLEEPPDKITSHISKTFPELEISEEKKEKIQDILSKAYIEPTVHRQVYENYLETNKRFYETGVRIFKELEGDVCPFCLTQKRSDDETITELLDYVESEYNEARNEVEEILSILEEYKGKVVDFVDKSNRNNPSIRKTINIVNADVDLPDIDVELKSFNSVLSVLKAKKKQMNRVDLHDGEDLFDKIDRELASVKKQYEQKLEVIKHVNAKTDNIISQKRNLGKQAIKNYMYEFWKQDSLRERLKELESEKEEIEEQLSQVGDQIAGDKTVDFFNSIIKCLGIHKYELSEDSKLILKLHAQHDISKEGFRISTGEKKFIAFSYFLAEVLSSVESGEELKNLSVIIDDPIDSSDHERFYSFVSVIESLDDILESIYENDLSIGQIIIFTHNALLYERFANSRKFSLYSISNQRNNSVMRKADGEKLMTLSKYLEVITGQIKKKERDRPEDIGNYIRRVLEIIASIENVGSNKIQDINEYPKLNPLANHLSHESVERMLDPLPKSHEYVEACIELIELIKNRIPLLYETIREDYLESRDIAEYRADYGTKYFISLRDE